jgi:hypothetical protein
MERWLRLRVIHATRDAGEIGTNIVEGRRPQLQVKGAHERVNGRLAGAAFGVQALAGNERIRGDFYGHVAEGSRDARQPSPIRRGFPGERVFQEGRFAIRGSRYLARQYNHLALPADLLSSAGGRERDPGAAGGIQQAGAWRHGRSLSKRLKLNQNRLVIGHHFLNDRDAGDKLYL